MKLLLDTHTGRFLTEYPFGDGLIISDGMAASLLAPALLQ
jgi:hypothetical protein